MFDHLKINLIKLQFYDKLMLSINTNGEIKMGQIYNIYCQDHTDLKNRKSLTFFCVIIHYFYYYSCSIQIVQQPINKIVFYYVEWIMLLYPLHFIGSRSVNQQIKTQFPFLSHSNLKDIRLICVMLIQKFVICVLCQNFLKKRLMD